MERIMMLVLCFLSFQSSIFGAIPNAESVPFLGIEGTASQLRKAVFAVQIEGLSPNTWIPLGSGFFIKGDPNQNYIVGVTCAHVVESASNKPIYIGMITDKGYKRFKCNVISIDRDIDVAIIKPQKDPNEEINIRDSASIV